MINNIKVNYYLGELAEIQGIAFTKIDHSLVVSYKN